MRHVQRFHTKSQGFCRIEAVDPREAAGVRGLEMIESLCWSCAQVREVISGKGSRFLLCLLAQSDSRFPKYPPQPVLRCGEYKPRQDDATEDAGTAGPD
jgi:hypothetical protein